MQKTVNIKGMGDFPEVAPESSFEMGESLGMRA
jgi:hypothetical protein